MPISSEATTVMNRRKSSVEIQSVSDDDAHFIGLPRVYVPNDPRQPASDANAALAIVPVPQAPSPSPDMPGTPAPKRLRKASVPHPGWEYPSVIESLDEGTNLQNVYQDTFERCG